MANSDRKQIRKLSKERRREFIEENDYHEVDTKPFGRNCCGAALHEFDAQTHDAWILQCPRDMDPGELLTNKRIKIPGRRYVGDVQVRATNYSQPLNEAIGYVNPKGKYSLRTLPLTGYVVVSKRLNLEKELPTGDEGVTYIEPTPPPQYKLPVRHPFFGRDYKSRIEVPKKIAKVLAEADRHSLETTAKLRQTGNYYKIRSKLLSTTQTLEEKERDVRQSVLTGVKPTFMDKTDHPIYVDLTNGDDEEKIKVETKKSKKHKVNVVKVNGNAEIVQTNVDLTNGDNEEEAQVLTKKSKKRKANGVKQEDEVVELVQKKRSKTAK
ncbi:uncharacterized protein Dwil_GK25433 [Drosophila willistoni]|uniref:Uncharacterized protein n=1 Tax=Drosophila willistoni TaxID=7260 RepID=B4NDP2_DROWI|nr:uncharacterized protein LOC6648305 [Drosophila willistoni]EDW81864.1 uncharacterized protein Dwil_GK25433 [Drosophila willistoni]